MSIFISGVVFGMRSLMMIMEIIGKSIFFFFDMGFNCFMCIFFFFGVCEGFDDWWLNEGDEVYVGVGCNCCCCEYFWGEFGG